MSTIQTDAVPAPRSAASLKARIVELMRQASTEITVGDEAVVPVLAALLPAGSCVHVAHTPKASLERVIELSLRVQQHGLRACPHIVARRIARESELRSALNDLKRIGVDQILLVAGDLPKPLGVFTSTLEILDSGATVDAGIRTIGVAGAQTGIRRAHRHRRSHCQPVQFQPRRHF